MTAVGAAVGLLALLAILGLLVARQRRAGGGQDRGESKPGRPWSVGRPSKKFQGDSDPLRAAANPLLNRRAPPSVKTYVSIVLALADGPCARHSLA